jgi:IclR family transcriptional regulator, KDG regulon repressor
VRKRTPARRAEAEIRVSEPAPKPELLNGEMATSSNPAPAVARAVRIVNYLLSAPDGAGVTEIAQALSMNKSTCFDILKTLTAFQVLTKHPRYAIYRLGPLLVQWGMASRRQLSGRTHIRESLRTLVSEVGLVCLVAQILAEEHGIVVVDRVEPARVDALTIPVGYVVPLSAPAMGRVVLSYMDEPEALRIARRLNMINGSQDSAFLDQLHKIRRLGYATSAGEFRPEFNAVAAAITRGNAEITSLLCIAGYTHHLPAADLDRLGERLSGLARELETHASMASV